MLARINTHTPFFLSPKPLIHLFWLLILSLLSTQALKSQIIIDAQVTAEITVCGTPTSFQIGLENPSTEVISGINVRVTFPEGILYIPGSLIATTTDIPITEADISLPNSPVFSISELPAQSELLFTINAEAYASAVNANSNTAELRNTISITSPLGNQNETSPPYNLLYGALSITETTPLSNTVYAGEVFSRSITVLNGGYGAISNFTLEDFHDNALLTVLSTDIGDLQADGQTILLNSGDFTSIGDGDGLLERNESITITEQILVSGCNDASSVINARWGCGGTTLESNTKYPYTEVQLKKPVLAVTPAPTFDNCLNAGTQIQEITISNTGQGPATSAVLNIQHSPNDVYAGIDLSSIELQQDGGSFESINASDYTAAPNYNCMPLNAASSYEINLPDISPGASISIRWEQFNCNPDECSPANLAGWQYALTYTDACDSKNYSNEGTGQATLGKHLSLFDESPSDLQDGETGIYQFLLTEARIDLPIIPKSRLYMVIDVPENMTYNPDNVLEWYNGAQYWTPLEMNFNSVTRQLTTTYTMPAPFEIRRSSISAKLTADCSAQTSDVTTAAIGLQLFYQIDNSCSENIRLPLNCKEVSLTDIHCPGDCSEGLSFERFEVSRTSFGAPDNDLDGLADLSGVLSDAVKHNRVMAQDTFQTSFFGTIKTQQPDDDWEFAFARSHIPYGNKIAALSASLTIHRTDGSTIIANQVPISTQIDGNGDLIADMDISPGSLVNAGNSNMSGITYQDGDQLVLQATYRLDGNIGAKIEQVRIENDFYVRKTANGSNYQCDSWSGHLTMIGYYFSNQQSEQYIANDCTVQINQDFMMSIGDCCSNYAGGNLFPYEYRNWAILEKARVQIPDGYTFITAQISQQRTTNTNTYVTESIDGLSPISTLDNQYDFDIASLYGNGIHPGDDGFRGTFSITLDPDCQLNQSANLAVNWTFFYRENEFLGGQPTGGYTATPDYVRYRRGRLRVSSNQPIQDGLLNTVSWNIKVKNAASAYVYNGWILPESLSGSLEVLFVIDLQTGDTLQAINSFYQLGNFNPRQRKDYQITARQASCDPSELLVHSGYDCDNYPTSQAAIECGYETSSLQVVPLPSELQTRIFNTPSANACDNEVEITIELLSAKLAAVKDIEILITVNDINSISLTNDFATIYPENSSPVTHISPPPSGNTYTLLLNDYIPSIIENGLPGIVAPTNNLVQLKLQAILNPGFRPGDFIRFEIKSKAACSDALPNLFIAHDPNALFTEKIGTGISEGGDNWAVAWGDYNADGFDDLFITSYDANSPNQLLRNEGDGTFSPILIAPFTTDLASSLAASWGDYDNDGDLDLYVANNIGTPNFLYRNQGNDLFVKVLNDDCVNDLGYAHGCSWVDYDNDGWLDIFVATYFSTQFNILYHNNADGTFSQAGDNAIALEAGNSVAGIWGDYNNDLLPDLFVANTNGNANSLYQNMGNGQFLRINSGAIVTDINHSVGGSWGDYDNDGDIDLFVANAANQANNLYRNDGNGSFTKVNAGELTSLEAHSHGSTWLDYDNDGWLDIYIANDQGQANALFHNNRNGQFTLIENASLKQLHSSFGVGWSDYDKNGSLDLFVANRAGDNNLLISNDRAACSNYLCIQLEGSSSNRSAIGAAVKVKANIYGESIWQHRVIEGQSGGGIGGQNSQSLHYGLGNADKVDSVIVIWPSGYEQAIDVNINDCNYISENSGTKVRGIAYHDLNDNCLLDSDEPVLANMPIRITQTNQLIFTNNSGQYEAVLPLGSYNIQRESVTNWTSTCNTSHSVDVTEQGGIMEGYNFAYKASCLLPDLQVEFSLTSNRVGMENLAILVIKNIGTQSAENVQILFSHNEFSLVNEASEIWDSYSESNVEWNLDALPAGNSQTIYLSLFVEEATPINIPLQYSLAATHTEDDCDNNNNIFQDYALSTGPIDPNDILVTPEGNIQADQVLSYKIRFQNVGTSVARQVIVEDELPVELDASTLEIGSISHAFSLRKEGRKLIWEFPNINLPDSLTNEEGSHGFINFRIRPKEGLSTGTSIKNQAIIYFDGQAGLVTNIVENTIDIQSTITDQNNQLICYPNPASEYLILAFKNMEVQDQFSKIELVNTSGQEVTKWTPTSNHLQSLRLPTLPEGPYWLKVMDQQGNHYGFAIIIQ
ncbi:MAG: FG-GAP-like repeat-containing protein [Chitinophagales bacterium]|nr:FG-GAP-like repeat-containing protein [Chitinophagales bacterium]